MKTIMKPAALAGTMALALASAGGAGAETIRATSGFGPAHPAAVHAYPEINTRLQQFTDGEWDLQDTPAGLVAPSEMSSGLRDGVTEFGTLLLPYFPAEYPESALPAELSILGSSNLVVSAAVTEYIVTCTECQAEFAENGQVFLATDATPPYNLLTVTPIRSVEDARGLRIRTGSPLYARFAAALGAEATQISSSELFESLSQGVINGTFSANHEIIANRLGDVIKYVTVVNEGFFNTAATATAGAMLWSGMDEDSRAALARASQYGIAKELFGFNEDAAKAEALEGIEFIQMDESLKAAKEAYNAEHLASAAAILTERGVKDAQAKADRYTALVEKWEGLITPGMTYEEMAELRYSEIFAGLDLGAYGQ